MLETCLARLAAYGAKRHPSVRLRFTAVAALGLLAGCTATATPTAGPDPSDPGVRVPAVGYRSTLGAYTSRRPVGPGSWREQNQRVAPTSE